MLLGLVRRYRHLQVAGQALARLLQTGQFLFAS